MSSMVRRAIWVFKVEGKHRSR